MCRYHCNLFKYWFTKNLKLDFHLLFQNIQRPIICFLLLITPFFCLIYFHNSIKHLFSVFSSRACVFVCWQIYCELKCNSLTAKYKILEWININTKLSTKSHSITAKKGEQLTKNTEIQMCSNNTSNPCNSKIYL